MLDKKFLIEQLEIYGKIIGSQQGNQLADDVIKYYSMWHACPGDNASYVFLEDAFCKWKAEYDLSQKGNYAI